MANAERDRAVFDLLACLADNKYYLGRRYAEWCSSAPTLESGVAAAAMAQDELGHARAIYPLLRDLAPADADPKQIDPDTRTAHLSLSALDHTFGGWPDFIAVNFLVDTALTTVFQAALTSAFEPLAARSRKVLQEERVHTLHGEAWVRRLARGAPPVRSAIQTALRAIWDETLCWFGLPGENGALLENSILDASPDTLRTRFLSSIGPTIAATTLILPLRHADGGQWALTKPLPWRRWDAATYRLRPPEPAAPRRAAPAGAKAVEGAR